MCDTFERLIRASVKSASLRRKQYRVRNGSDVPVLQLKGAHAAVFHHHTEEDVEEEEKKGISNKFLHICYHSVI